MSFADFLRDLDWNQNPNKPNSINLSSYRAPPDDGQKYNIQAYALLTVADYIATLMTKVQWRTIINGSVTTGENWYKLNVKPNINQSAPEFWKAFFLRLLLQQEVLAVEQNDQWFVAEDFDRTEFALYPDVFKDVTLGQENPIQLQMPFYGNDVLYLRYANSDVNAAIRRVLALYNDIVNQSAEAHRLEGGEHGILNVGRAAQGPKEYESRYGKWVNSQFKRFFTSRNAVIPLFGGMTYTATTSKAASGEASKVNEIKAMTKEALTATANAYKVVPALILGEAAGVKEALQGTLTACIDPLAQMVAAELTGKLFSKSEIISGSRVEAVTNCIKHVELFDVANEMDKLYAIGFSHAELRPKLGEPVPDEPWAYEHNKTKNYETAGGVSDAEGNTL